LWVSSVENAPILDGFCGVTILPKEASFNAIWFIDGNLMPLGDGFIAQGRRLEQKELMVSIVSSSSQSCVIRLVHRV
jgi:hypothetical protein